MKGNSNGEGYAVLQKGNKRLKLTVTTGSDGKEFLDISKLYSETGMCTYDPGFKSTAACKSSITRIDGENAVLKHMGHSIEKLVNQCSYEEVAYLLFYGELPNESELGQFHKMLAQNRQIPQEIIEHFKHYKRTTHPMQIMSATMGLLPTVYGEVDINDKNAREQSCFKILAQVATIAAMAYKHAKGEQFIAPNPELSLSDNLLHMMFSTPNKAYEIKPEISSIFNKLLILHIDHEQNVSTTSARVVGSSGSNVFSVIAAGITSLSGPLHGGANEEVIKMLNKIASVENIPTFIEGVKAKKERLMGFGHRVYRNYDPRGAVIKEECAKLLNSIEINPALFAVAQKLEATALNDEYFTSRKLFPNIDFYSGLIYLALGIPKEMFTVMFAVARTAGWLAQWLEMVEDKETKIARPRQIYTGLIDR